jgi:tetratricopeptide (TPR) repeat protein
MAEAPKPSADETAPAETPPAATPPAEATPAATTPAEATAPAESKPEEAKPKEPTAEDLYTEGRDALFKGDFEKAIDLLGKAVTADPTKTNYRLHLARAYRYAGRDDEAVPQLDAILKTAPDHVEAGQTLGEIHAAAKRWKEVVQVLEPLLTYRHDYPTYHMLAEAQYNLDQLEAARRSYEEAIKLNPQSASDHYQLGNIYLSGNFFALAAES